VPQELQITRWSSGSAFLIFSRSTVLAMSDETLLGLDRGRPAESREASMRTLRVTDCSSATLSGTGNYRSQIKTLKLRKDLLTDLNKNVFRIVADVVILEVAWEAIHFARCADVHRDVNLCAVSAFEARANYILFAALQLPSVCGYDWLAGTRTGDTKHLGASTLHRIPHSVSSSPP
jgi:hypothetical protein